MRKLRRAASAVGSTGNTSLKTTFEYRVAAGGGLNPSKGVTWHWKWLRDLQAGRGGADGHCGNLTSITNS